MSKILYYMAHDPVGNTEALLTEFDAELISHAAENGIVFVAVYDDGERKIVLPDDVKEPVLDDRPITLVQPAYVDDRMTAVVEVFDALAAEMSGTAMVMSADAGPAAARATFAEALEKLKELVGNGAE